MTLDGLSGRLVLRPGGTVPVTCERPMVGAALLDKLTTGRHAALLPDIIASVFTLCADAQRSTSRRAIKAALGSADSAAEHRRDELAIGLHTAREHLQRLALDLPGLAPVAGAATASPQWLRDAPVMALPPAAANETTLRAIAVALPGWLERRLFGMPPEAWLEGWQREGAAWLASWCQGRDQPFAAWLDAVRGEAQTIAWPCRALDALHDGADGMHVLATAVAADRNFAERPLWHALPAETAPWTRRGRVAPVRSAWDRLGARLADLAQIATGVPLTLGSLALGAGEGIAWTEMSRGLLVHWVRLDGQSADPASTRAQRYQVLAPTEWNFHPHGAFASWLRESAPSAARVRLAAATLDPCVAFAIEPEPQHA
jgi:hypothetical protein